GRLDGGELARCYGAAQAFAMPFARESFGIAALEAMAFGLPVIGSAAGGVREFVRHGENGLLIPAGDLAGCRRAVAELAQNRRRLADLGVQAFRDFLGRPGWGDSLAGACRFLEAQATHRPGGSPRRAREDGNPR
ncbi:MAG: glycosyltransferase, partial [Desulfobacterales bacterium]